MVEWNSRMTFCNINKRFEGVGNEERREGGSHVHCMVLSVSHRIFYEEPAAAPHPPPPPPPQHWEPVPFASNIRTS